MHVRFEQVSKSFGATAALSEVDLQVEAGECLVLLGPSGCGKTTLLRLLAGLERVDSGRIFIGDRLVNDVPPARRDVAMVFQSYALYPHFTVRDNIAFPLRARGVARSERDARVGEAARRLELSGLLDRRPAQLSGGQQQRIALARALINRPEVLLLDEPLGALDLKLREQMQVELKALQRQVGITFIYVTHDQGEALSMSDRLAVFNLGRIEQIDTPAAMYEHPATAFVAGFVGVSNVCEGELARRLSGAPEPFAIRPEKIRIALEETPVPDGWIGAPGRVESVVYLGAATRYAVALDGGGSLTALHQNADDRDAALAPGARVRVSWQARHRQPLSAVQR
jgi:putative spermidine/putrescine transport system ATP-binding protein